MIGACLDEQIEFSLTLSRNRRVTTAIDSIDETDWTPVHYPGAVLDPDTGALISDAEVAETHPHPQRAGAWPPPPPDWWCAGSRTPATHPRCSRCGAITRLSPTPPCPPPGHLPHRKHAIIETTFADLIDGPLAHIPSVIWS